MESQAALLRFVRVNFIGGGGVRRSEHADANFSSILCDLRCEGNRASCSSMSVAALELHCSSACANSNPSSMSSSSPHAELASCAWASVILRPWKLFCLCMLSVVFCFVVSVR